MIFYYLVQKHKSNILFELVSIAMFETVHYYIR